jgi:hypothetical protein
MPLVVAGPAGLLVLGVGRNVALVDSFEKLLTLAGVEDMDELPPRGGPVTAEEAARLLTLLLNTPVTLGSFPPRMAVAHMLREVLEEGEVSREELLRRVERFNLVAVLRPDGYVAWTRSGRTQQKAIGNLEWKDGAFRAGPLELGRFYVVKGQVFRHADERLRPVRDAEPLAEVYDDADYISRTLDGAQDAFEALYHAMGQLLSRPTDSLLALQHLPAGMMALLASSPEYLERVRYMTRGEQIREFSRLATHLLVTWGAAAGTTRALASATHGAQVTVKVPVLSLSKDGALAVESARQLVLPVGSVGTVLSGGPGAVIVLQMVGKDGLGGSTQDYVRMGADGNGIVATIDESGVVELAVAAPKGSALRGSDLFRGMMEHFGGRVRAIRGNWRYGDNLAEVNRLVGQGATLESAVAQTWTARRAAEYGFVRRVVTEVVGEAGSYSFVQVVFTR